MKNIIILFFLYSSITILAQGNGHPLTYDDFDTLNVNNIRLVTSNVGNCDGARWLALNPVYGKTIIYDHGPWVIGKVNGEPILSIIFIRIFKIRLTKAGKIWYGVPKDCS